MLRFPGKEPDARALQSSLQLTHHWETPGPQNRGWRANRTHSGHGRQCPGLLPPGRSARGNSTAPGGWTGLPCLLLSDMGSERATGWEVTGWRGCLGWDLPGRQGFPVSGSEPRWLGCGRASLQTCASGGRPVGSVATVWVMDVPVPWFAL